jgi:hypothetical protein
VPGGVAAQPLHELAIATVTLMEVRFGIATLPHGQRRTELDRQFRQFLAQGCADRIPCRSIRPPPMRAPTSVPPAGA